MTRNEYIREDHKDGKDIGQIAREHGLSTRRIQQILKEMGIRNTRLKSSTEANPISKLHAKIGIRTYNHRYDKFISVSDAAKMIGWSVQKLRRVEKGFVDITLLDMKDLALYLGVDPTELWRNDVDSV